MFQCELRVSEVDLAEDDRIDCEEPLAIDSAWTPSCCRTCRAWRRVDSLFMSASTSWPTPRSMESIRLCVKVFCRSMLSSGGAKRRGGVRHILERASTTFIWSAICVSLKPLPVVES